MKSSFSDMHIRDLIEVPAVETVVQLSDNPARAEKLLRSFVLTGEVDAHFDILAESLAGETGTGCFLRGDFGSGKSHFLAALAGWLRQSPGSEAIAAGHPRLGDLRATGRRFLAVELSLVAYRSTTPLEQILVTAIEERLHAVGVDVSLTPLAAFLKRLRELLTDPGITHRFSAAAGVGVDNLSAWIEQRPRDAYASAVPFFHAEKLPPPEFLVEDRHETLARAVGAVREAGYDGVVLLIDELSEFFRSKSGGRWLNEDARTLQFLGEFAARHRLWIVAAVQESIEKTGDIAQATFRKIRDRFPLRLVLSTVHVRELIARRLVVHREGADEHLLRIHEHFRRHFPSFTYPFELFRDIYPVHPLTLGLLEGLSDLFSEHRGIVDFVHTRIAGGKGGAGILDRPATDLLAPDSIYEHFEQRLAEFSDYNVFPRRIVPALDELIAAELDEEDRPLARRLVRMLVLYHIHPVAETPPVAGLAELAACSVMEGLGDVNAEFVGEAILAPLAEASPFLVRQTPAETPLSETVFAIATRDDGTGTLEPRIEKILEDVPPDDTRPFLAAIGHMDDQPGWFPGFTREVVECPLVWNGASRRGRLHFCLAGDERECGVAIARERAVGEAEFAVIAAMWDTRLEAPPEAVAVWRIEAPVAESVATLRRWFAASLLAEELRPGNPAQASLIEPVRALAKRLAGEAVREAVAQVFRGSFTHPSLVMPAYALQLQRLDRIVQTAGEALLAERYPRAGEIAPRNGVQASPRQYQRLLDEFCREGGVSLQEARRTGLSSLVDGLAAPLGIVEVKSAAYQFNPDPLGHPLLVHLHGCLAASGQTAVGEAVAALTGPPFGLGEETAEFLLLALAVGGLLSLSSRGRTYPVDFLRMGSLSQVERVAPGELLGQGDRELLMAEVEFLAPVGGWTSFGLKQQRDAWRDLCKLSKRLQPMIEACRGRLDELAGYEAFSGFAGDDGVAIRGALRVVEGVLGEVKISYSAREGLERFLAAWRSRAADSAAFAFVQRLHRFLDRGFEAVIFVSHYLGHPVVRKAMAENEELAIAGGPLIDQLGHPVELLDHDDPERVLGDRFDTFRHLYAAYYSCRHAAFQVPQAKLSLSRQAKRAVAVLRRLAGVAALGQPESLSRLLNILDAPAPTSCTRRVEEILSRSPLCDCGYTLEAPPEQAVGEAPDSLVDSCLDGYATLLRSPHIQEAIRARRYAVRDAAPAAARRLEGLIRFGEVAGDRPGTLLVDLLDEATVGEMEQALSGRVRVVRRRLATLAETIQGRQLRPGQLREAFDQWVGETDETTLVAVAGAVDGGDHADCAWWAALAGRGFPQLGLPKASEAPFDELSRAFPPAELGKRMGDWRPEQLLDFIGREPFHLDAVREAWNLLLQRLLSGAARDLAPRVECALVDAAAAAALHRRLEATFRLVAAAKPGAHVFPESLRTRLDAVALAEDPWCDEEAVRLLRTYLASLAAAGNEWCDSLAATPAAGPDEAVTVVVVDGCPPDVWLAAAESIPSTFMEKGEASWRRLDASPTTGAGVAAIFGLAGDAAEALPAAGVDYHHLTGRETVSLADLIPEAPAGACVIRIALLDSGAHAGSIRLQDMPVRLSDCVRQRIEPYRDHCLKSGRGFLLTTDHGCSWRDGKLEHGAGGVFEQALFQLRCP